MINRKLLLKLLLAPIAALIVFHGVFRILPAPIGHDPYFAMISAQISAGCTYLFLYPNELATGHHASNRLAIRAIVIMAVLFGCAVMLLVRFAD